MKTYRQKFQQLEDRINEVDEGMTYHLTVIWVVVLITLIIALFK